MPLAHQYTHLRVFVASPGDVLKEKGSVEAVANAINREVGHREGFHLDVVRFETDTRPAAGRAQGVINRQIGRYHIFVGIMADRFGMATGRAGSGTEEEFNRAYAAWQRRTVKPEIMFYFRKASVKGTPPPSDQRVKVERFKKKVFARTLASEYGSATAFPETLRPHLLDAAREAFKVVRAAERAAKRKKAAGPSGKATKGKKGAKTSSPKAAAPPVTGPPTDLSRAEFVRSALRSIRLSFGKAARKKEDEGRFQFTFTSRGDSGFVIEAFRSGALALRASIWREDGWRGTPSLAFAVGRHLDAQRPGSAQLSFDVADGEGAPGFTQGMSFGSSGALLRPGEAAARCWEHFARQLQYA